MEKLQLIAYNKVYDYDFMLINNINDIMLFKYNARFRIKKDLRDEIFLNTKIKGNIDTINKHLRMWQVVAVCKDKFMNITYYDIITYDKYLREHTGKYDNISVPTYNKSKQTNVLDLSDLD